MSIVYRLMYLVGFTPWDDERVSPELTSASEALPAGRALDIGCGTGTQAVYLAKAGWTTVGLDAVEQPLRRARQRAAAAGVDVRWIRGDVTRLDELGLEPGFTLFHDRGCFHGLSESARRDYIAGIGSLAAPRARLVMMCFARNRKLGGPTGVVPSEIELGFAREWELMSAQPDTGPAPPGPMRSVPRTWYQLVRR
jgi:SAM-dependent methyltransferase